MCTCINLIGKNTYFGRNMDIDASFGEKIIFVPRNYKINFKKEKTLEKHYSILGIGTVVNDYPLFADAINEYGLGFAGLNFVNNAYYYKVDKNKENYAPYELPLILLSTCKSIKDVKKLLKKINIVDIDFDKGIKNALLHFMIGDKNGSIVIETTLDGMKVYDNPFNVLTNNPPFPFHKENVCNYMQLHNDLPKNNLMKDYELKSFCLNQGAISLPGDFSSPSRFIKCLYVKNNLVLNNDDTDIIQFFKCMDSVSMPLGSVKTEKYYAYTYYTSCYNLNDGALYYKTYFSNIKQIKIKMNSNQSELSIFDL